MKLNIQLFADGSVIIPVDLDTKGFDRQIAQLEYQLDELLDQYKEMSEADRFASSEEGKARLRELGAEIEKTQNRIVSLRKQQQGLNEDIKSHGFSLSNTIQKIGKWGLALFGIRSAYSFVTQAASRLSNTNKQIGADLQYMRWALAQMLEKVIVRIIQWAYKLLQIINYVVYGVTGINLFANASAKAFERQNKAMSGTAKSAKQLQKTLAGFDEMNILQENGSTGYGGGGGGITLPSDDLNNFNEISGTLKNTLDGIIKVLQPVWNWLVKIVKKLGGVQSVILGIIGLKLISKVAKLLGAAGSTAGAGATGLLGILSVLGLLVADVWLIKIASEGYEEVSKEAEDLNKRLDGLNDSTKKSNKSWKQNTKEMIENAKAGKYDEEQLKNIAQGLLNDAKNSKAVSESLEEQKTVVGFLSGAWTRATKAQKELNDEYEHDIEMLEELAKQGLLNKDVQKQLEESYLRQIDAIEKQRKEAQEGSYDYQVYTERIDELKLSLDRIKGNYTATLNVKGDTTQARKSISDLLKDVQSAGIAGALGLSNIASKIKTIGRRKGGIINMPSRGVPLNVGGESGPEGLVPLTDSQQMELLGGAIGRHINLTATIPVYAYNRQVAKEIRKIQLEDQFAGNR